MISLRWLVFGVLAISLAGCGSRRSSPTPTVPVKGVVKLNGKPLPGGQITFHGDGDKPVKVSSGINGDGQYELAVPVGNYKVTVDNASLKTTASTALGGKSAAMPGMTETAATKYVAINANYATPDKSGLSTNVQGAAHTYDVDLK